MSASGERVAGTHGELVARLDALVAGLASPDEGTRREAGETLLALDDPRATGYLRKLARSRDPLARYHGKLALARLEGRKEESKRTETKTREASGRAELRRRAGAWLAAHRLRLFLIAALLVAFGGARQLILAAREAEARAPLLAAERLYLEGKRQPARAAYAAFLKVRPTDPETLARLADLAFADSDFAEARRLLETLEAADRGSFEFRRMAGKSLLARPAEAVPFYRALLAERPGDPQTALEFALALRLAGETDEALRALDTLLSRQPNFLSAAVLRAELLAKRGDAQGADAAYAAAIRLNPGDADARTRLGLARFDRGDHAGAADAFAEALLSRPADAALSFNLGLALERTGRDAEALRAYGDALTVDPAHRAARLNLAVLHGRAGRRDLETVEYRKLAERDPTFAAAFFNAGVAALDAREPERANRHFDRAANLAPKFAAALVNAGLLDEALGRQAASTDPAEAERLRARAVGRFRAALRLDPSDPTSAERLAALGADGAMTGGAR